MSVSMDKLCKLQCNISQIKCPHIVDLAVFPLLGPTFSNSTQGPSQMIRKQTSIYIPTHMYALLLLVCFCCLIRSTLPCACTLN